MEMKLRNVDVIVTHYKDGHVVPNKIRMIGDEGLRETYVIVRFRDLSHRGTHITPDGVDVDNCTLIFDCIINMHGIERLVHLYNNPPHQEWFISDG